MRPKGTNDGLHEEDGRRWIDWGICMGGPDFDFDDAGSKAPDVAGTPEGDGDFESDNLSDSGETSAGGQVAPQRDLPDGSKAENVELTLLEKVIDEISHGTLLP
jgi:hypothetical protein